MLKVYGLVLPTLPRIIWRIAASIPMDPVKLLVYISDCSVPL
jgi:hypothetical protein